MGNIYFRKEAEEWNQAFPIGNGFLGAMVFGNVAKERIQVNEDSVWSGGFSNRVNPDAGRYLEKIRECLFEGNVQEAEKLAEQSMYATSPNMRVYQPLGDIWIRFMDQEAERKLARDESGLPYLKESAAEVEAYQRILNLEQAVGKIEYCVGRTKWNREFFASNPAKVAMYSICAESGEDINLEISATRKDNRSGRGVSFCDRILAEENQYIWLILWITQAGIYLLHFFLAMRFGSGACLAAGVTQSLIAALLFTGLGDGLWMWFPCGWSGHLLLYYVKWKTESEVFKMAGEMLKEQIRTGVLSMVGMTITGLILWCIWIQHHDRKSISQ